MKEQFSLTHKCSSEQERPKCIKDFCERFKQKDLKYIGCFVKKSDCTLVGDIVQMGKYYYRASIDSGYNDGDTYYTTAIFLIYRDYNPDNLDPVGNYRIRVNVWDMDIDDEGPVLMYAFKHIGQAEDIIYKENDVDIWIDGKEVSREDFLERRFQF